MIRADLTYGTIEKIDQFLGGDRGLSSEKRSNSSELSFHSSEVSFHSSELLYPDSVGNFRLLRGAFRFPRDKTNVGTYSAMPYVPTLFVSGLPLALGDGGSLV